MKIIPDRNYLTLIDIIHDWDGMHILIKEFIELHCEYWGVVHYGISGTAFFEATPYIAEIAYCHHSFNKGYYVAIVKMERCENILKQLAIKYEIVEEDRYYRIKIPYSEIKPKQI